MLDESNGVFHLNQIPVRYVDAAVVGFPTNKIRNGDPIRVQGMPIWVVPGFSCCEASDGGINADAIEYIDYLSITPGVLISGMITRWATPSDFDINGQPVSTDSSTRYAGLNLPAVLQEGTEGHWLTVFGPMDERGVLHARLIDTQNSANLGLQGPVTGLDSDARIVQVLGVPVEVSTSTLMTQRDIAGTRASTFADLYVGSGVSVSGFTISYLGHVAAMRIEQSDPSSQVSLQHWHNVRLAHEPTFPITIGSTTLTVATANTQLTMVIHWPMDALAGIGQPAASGRSLNPGPGDHRAIQVFGTERGSHHR